VIPTWAVLAVGVPAALVCVGIGAGVMALLTASGRTPNSIVIEFPVGRNGWHFRSEAPHLHSTEAAPTIEEAQRRAAQALLAKLEGERLRQMMTPEQS
jgi:hypothetical protein